MAVYTETKTYHTKAHMGNGLPLAVCAGASQLA